MRDFLTGCVLATTSSFAETDNKPVRFLEQNGLEVIRNPYKKKLESFELLELLRTYKPVGLLAGLEVITEQVITEAKSHLKVISRVGVGIDNIDTNALENSGLILCVTPDIVTPAVAELVVGLVFSLLRHIGFHDRCVREGRWEKHMGMLLRNKKLGVFGFGKIGQEVGRLMSALGCQVSAFDPYTQDAVYEKMGVKKTSSLKSLLSENDIVSIHVPSTPETQKIISFNEFSYANKNLYLINAARGEVIEEIALIDALQNRKIAGAALDVFEMEPYKGELTHFDNVILTPHIGSYAKEIKTEMEFLAAKNLVDSLSVRKNYEP